MTEKELSDLPFAYPHLLHAENLGGMDSRAQRRREVQQLKSKIIEEISDMFRLCFVTFQIAHAVGTDPIRIQDVSECAS